MAAEGTSSTSPAPTPVLPIAALPGAIPTLNTATPRSSAAAAASGMAGMRRDLNAARDAYDHGDPVGIVVSYSTSIIPYPHMILMLM
jgi:Asp-tRNA(Asn)/Glu-tRNA(Gln) amidotransferase B subunit